MKLFLTDEGDLYILWWFNVISTLEVREGKRQVRTEMGWDVRHVVWSLWLICGMHAAHASLLWPALGHSEVQAKQNQKACDWIKSHIGRGYVYCY